MCRHLAGVRSLIKGWEGLDRGARRALGSEQRRAERDADVTAEALPGGV